MTWFGGRNWGKSMGVGEKWVYVQRATKGKQKRGGCKGHKPNDPMEKRGMGGGSGKRQKAPVSGEGSIGKFGKEKLGQSTSPIKLRRGGDRQEEKPLGLK